MVYNIGGLYNNYDNETSLSIDNLVNSFSFYKNKIKANREETYRKKKYI